MSKSLRTRKGVCRGVIGVDEVGRGPFAGPVTVCAVYVEDGIDIKKSIFSNMIRDSKKLGKSSRINIYTTIRQNRKFNRKILYAIASRSAAYIDRSGIVQALRSCVVSCVRSLEKQGVDIREVEFRLDAGLMVPINDLIQQSFIKGDEKHAEIALASIMAKVSRDRYMERLAKTHKEYGWDRNAGYGTLEHRKAIKKHGTTCYHRKTYLKGF